jgi:hypothetical protein
LPLQSRKDSLEARFPISQLGASNRSLVPDPIALRERGNASPGGIAQEIFAQPPSVSEKSRGRIRIDEDACQQLCRVPMGMKKLGIDHSDPFLQFHLDGIEVAC